MILAPQAIVTRDWLFAAMNAFAFPEIQLSPTKLAAAWPVTERKLRDCSAIDVGQVKDGELPTVETDSVGALHCDACNTCHHQVVNIEGRAAGGHIEHNSSSVSTNVVFVDVAVDLAKMRTHVLSAE
jgi:hypothetical protein